MWGQAPLLGLPSRPRRERGQGRRQRLCEPRARHRHRHQGRRRCREGRPLGRRGRRHAVGRRHRQRPAERGDCAALVGEANTRRPRRRLRRRRALRRRQRRHGSVPTSAATRLRRRRDETAMLDTKDILQDAIRQRTFGWPPRRGSALRGRAAAAHADRRTSPKGRDPGVIPRNEQACRCESAARPGRPASAETPDACPARLQTAVCGRGLRHTPVIEVPRRLRRRRRAPGPVGERPRGSVPQRPFTIVDSCIYALVPGSWRIDSHREHRVGTPTRTARSRTGSASPGQRGRAFARLRVQDARS